MNKRAIHIAAGAGFSNDRRALAEVAARSLATVDGPRYLIFECLAERTMALSQTKEGFKHQSERALSRLIPCLSLCVGENIRVVSNFGGSDPEGVAEVIQAYLSQHKIPLRVGVVVGDRLNVSVADSSAKILSCNAYIGAIGIVEALEEGADIIVTGRVADPSLVVGAVAHECNLAWDDWDNLALATLGGHLIECCTQVCGGYFSDGEHKHVPDIANLGTPIASIHVSSGTVDISKPLGGGAVTEATVKEQLLYEIHNPSNYKTPDVVMDIGAVRVTQIEPNVVRAQGVRGVPKPSQLKTISCFDKGWIGEGEISYLGESALSRAQIAQSILSERVATLVPDARHHFDIIDGRFVAGLTECAESTDEVMHTHGLPHARLRIAVTHDNRTVVQQMLDEVEALYLNGPAGGGGIRLNLSPRIATVAGYIDRTEVSVSGRCLEIANVGE